MAPSVSTSSSSSSGGAPAGTVVVDEDEGRGKRKARYSRPTSARPGRVSSALRAREFCTLLLYEYVGVSPRRDK